MSRHIPRRDRWQSAGPDCHRSIDGLSVRRSKGEWWAEVGYQTLAAQPGESGQWQSHFDRLGPFKRPRNAMVEAERHATSLRNRHGDRIRFTRVEESRSAGD